MIRRKEKQKIPLLSKTSNFGGSAFTGHVINLLKLKFQNYTSIEITNISISKIILI